MKDYCPESLESSIVRMRINLTTKAILNLIVMLITCMILEFGFYQV